jgi:hypothetical protein
MAVVACTAGVALVRAVVAVVVEQVFDRLVHVVGLGLWIQEPGDESAGVVDVLRRRNEVGVRPQFVPAFGADLIRQLLPHGGRLAQSPGAKLESDERGEGRLGRSARGATTANRLRDRGRLRQPARRIRGDHVDPTLDEGQHRLEPREGSQLGRRLRRDERAARHRVA